MNDNLSDPQYWDDRYNEKNDIWSLNKPNPVLVQAFEEKMILPPAGILVAGAGKGEDPVFLAKNGFSVTAIDFSSKAVEYLKARAGEEGVELNPVQGDLFNLEKEYPEAFDIIYEYVTICAVEPSRVEELVKNFAAALKPGGIFMSVLFPIDGREGGPPFAIDLLHFYSVAQKYLKLEFYSREINSLRPRKGNEVLLIFRKGNHGAKS